MTTLLRVKGRVVRLKKDKGFGFLHAENQDFFFHMTDCEAYLDLQEGQTVTFQPQETPKGPRAREVRAA